MTSAARDIGRVPVDHVVSLLRERLYGAISCLALLPIGVIVLTIKIVAH